MILKRVQKSGKIVGFRMNFCSKNLFANPRKFPKIIIFFSSCGIAVFAVVTAFA